MLTTESSAALEAKRSQLRIELARIDFELARRSSEWSQQMQQDRGLWLAEQERQKVRVTALGG